MAELHTYRCRAGCGLPRRVCRRSDARGLQFGRYRCPNFAKWYMAVPHSLCGHKGRLKNPFCVFRRP
ncbi:hypothetical protein [Kingella potus]|uniref:hypothetical protein n=1 Tax=Kingella potus TaxID=265175 RepID=UPI001FD5FECF|nr:hypothetical protein [Kingella potus]UOP01318.1 hypothetical protein LVJ84_03460 [Kingella potus]